MDPELVESTTQTFGLGGALAEPVAISGGFLNSMWQVFTDKGQFAVKVLAESVNSPTLSYRYEDAYRLELAAVERGVLAPTPVVNSMSGGPLARLLDSQGRAHRVLVHAWVDAPILLPGEVSTDFAHALGESVGVIHSIDLDAPIGRSDSIPEMPTPADLLAMADAGAAQELGWAADLRASLDAVATACELVDGLRNVGRPQVFTHGDVTHKNLLRLDDKPVLVDWETADHRALAYEVCGAALCMAHVGPGVFDFEVVSAFFAGYRSAGMPLPAIAPDLLAAKLQGTTCFLLFNMERCLNPHLDDADTQERSNFVVRKMIHELRDTISTLDRTYEILQTAAHA